ncbi:keto-hydroxyglutarate-aldolase/keto-deoxy-phosphogluconate aldolase [Citrobacter koseri]|uniref:Keto-hydroxyglutarate-aldolase/keto-deoxy-phosphogluconate aldolase n=1 Tax=Citrobacter koseri TaxID=545 RepID=A0A2X2VNF1_CITKO|nr:keto-hydroxyglutarate-aldolase/keto-deoxy-phosphogluconate aldolase [Citrobacter koseri]
MDAIRAIAKEVPEAIIGAGTVLNAQQLAEVTEAGAQFAISPGLTEPLLESGDRRHHSADSRYQHCFRTDAGYGLRPERVQILPGGS